jgi:hypothetical protein
MRLRGLSGARDEFHLSLPDLLHRHVSAIRGASNKAFSARFFCGA